MEEFYRPAVTVRWANHHVWAAGRSQRRVETAAHALWLVRAGTVTAHIYEGEVTIPVRAGEALLTTAPITRDVTAGGDGAEWLTVGLSASADLFAPLGLPLHWQPDPEQRPRLDALLSLVIEEWGERRAPDRTAACRVALAAGEAALALVWQSRFGSDAPFGQSAGGAANGAPPWLSEALRHMNAAPQHHLPEFIAAAGRSEAQFRRAFGRWVGASPHEYLTGVRLEHARRVLAATDRSAAEIAEEVGFASLAHFTRRFKAAFGVPPAEYRRRSRLPGI